MAFFATQFILTCCFLAADATLAHPHAVRLRHLNDDAPIQEMMEHLPAPHDTGIISAKLNWNIELDDVVSRFGSGWDNSFLVTYSHDNVTNAKISTHVFDGECRTQYNGEGLTAGPAMVDPSGLVSSQVYVDFSKLRGSPFWSVGPGSTFGDLKFCYRINVGMEGHVLNWVQTIVSAKMNLLGKFSTQSSGQKIMVVADYPLVVYTCNDQSEPIAPVPVSPGGILQVCLAHGDDNSELEVQSIFSASVTQEQHGGGTFEFAAIEDGIVHNQETGMDCVTLPGVCRLITVLDEDVWFDDEAGLLKVVGTAILVPKHEASGNSRRRVKEATFSAGNGGIGRFLTQKGHMDAYLPVGEFGLEFKTKGKGEVDIQNSISSASVDKSIVISLAFVPLVFLLT